MCKGGEGVKFCVDVGESQLLWNEQIVIINQ